LELLSRCERLRIGTAVDTRFINGVFESREHLTVALNLEELLSECELAVPQSIAA